MIDLCNRSFELKNWYMLHVWYKFWYVPLLNNWNFGHESDVLNFAPVNAWTNLTMCAAPICFIIYDQNILSASFFYSISPRQLVSGSSNNICLPMLLLCGIYLKCFHEIFVASCIWKSMSERCCCLQREKLTQLNF